MLQVMLEDNDSQAAGWVEQALAGEEIIIVRDSKPVAKIIPLPEWAEQAKRGGFGSGKHDILYMADDFDAPLEDFKDYT